MRRTLILAICLLVLIQTHLSLAHSPQRSAKEILRATTIIFRHGERNPLKPAYPKDPYRDEAKYWPEGYGSVTTQGKIQMYNLGRYIRKRYPMLQKRNVMVYSSDNNRTIASAMSNLAGLYGHDRSFLKHLDTFSPRGFGIKVVPISQDNFIMVKEPCPKYNQLQEKYLQKARPLDKYKGDLEIINKQTGMNFSQLDSNIVTFADTIAIQKSRNLTLSPWLEELYIDGVIADLREEYFRNMIPTFEMTRLKSGKMMETFIDEMDKVIFNVSGIQSEAKTLQANPNFPKIFIESAHDTTIALWMIPLNVFDWESPPCGAALFLEIYEVITNAHKNEFILKIFYRKTEDEESQLSLPGCPNPCRYSQFKNMVMPLLVEDRKEECQPLNATEIETRGNTKIETMKSDRGAKSVRRNDASFSSNHDIKIIPMSLLLTLFFFC